MPDNALAKPTPQWVPVSFEHNAFNAFRKAYELDQAATELHFEALPGTSDAQMQQREAILEVARRLLRSRRDKYMDHAVELWIKYRTMTEPSNG